MNKQVELNEEVNPFSFTGKGKIDVRDDSVRDNINIVLTGMLRSCCLTPYIALEKVRKALAYFHIPVPAVPFMEGERGFHVFEIDQFGYKYGVKDDRTFVQSGTTQKDTTHGSHTDGESFNDDEPSAPQHISQKYHLYFEYRLNDKGMFDVFCEIVDQDELHDLLNDVEEDMDNDVEDDRESRLDEEENLQELTAPTQANLKALNKRAIARDIKAGRKQDKAYAASDRADAASNLAKKVGLKGLAAKLRKRSNNKDAEANKQQGEIMKAIGTQSRILKRVVFDRRELKEEAKEAAREILKKRNE